MQAGKTPCGKVSGIKKEENHIENTGRGKQKKGGKGKKRLTTLGVFKRRSH